MPYYIVELTMNGKIWWKIGLVLVLVVSNIWLGRQLYQFNELRVLLQKNGSTDLSEEYDLFRGGMLWCLTGRDDGWFICGGLYQKKSDVLMSSVTRINDSSSMEGVCFDYILNRNVLPSGEITWRRRWAWSPHWSVEYNDSLCFDHDGDGVLDVQMVADGEYRELEYPVSAEQEGGQKP